MSASLHRGQNRTAAIFQAEIRPPTCGSCPPVDGSHPGAMRRTRQDQRSGSSPAKKLLYVGEFELDVSGAAVIALTAMRRRLHLAQECVHLIGIETASGAHAHVAG